MISGVGSPRYARDDKSLFEAKLMRTRAAKYYSDLAASFDGGCRPSPRILYSRAL